MANERILSFMIFLLWLGGDSRGGEVHLGIVDGGLFSRLIVIGLGDYDVLDDGEEVSVFVGAYQYDEEKVEAPSADCFYGFRLPSLRDCAGMTGGVGSVFVA